MFCDRISSSLWNCKIKIQIINRCLNTPSIFSTLLAWLHIHCVHFNRVYPCFFFFIFFSSFFNFPLCFSLTSLSPVGTMLQCFLFLSLFFFCCFYSTILTTSLSPPLCYFVDCKKKKKRWQAETIVLFLLSSQQTWSKRRKWGKKKDCRSYSLYEVNHFGRRFTDRCFFFFFRSDHVGLADEHVETREHDGDPGSFASLLSQVSARFHPEK